MSVTLKQTTQTAFIKISDGYCLVNTAGDSKRGRTSDSFRLYFTCLSLASLLASATSHGSSSLNTANHLFVLFINFVARCLCSGFAICAGRGKLNAICIRFASSPARRIGGTTKGAAARQPLTAGQRLAMRVRRVASPTIQPAQWLQILAGCVDNRWPAPAARFKLNSTL